MWKHFVSLHFLYFSSAPYRILHSQKTAELGIAWFDHNFCLLWCINPILSFCVISYDFHQNYKQLSLTWTNQVSQASNCSSPPNACNTMVFFMKNVSYPPISTANIRVVLTIKCHRQPKSCSTIIVASNITSTSHRTLHSLNILYVTQSTSDIPRHPPPSRVCMHLGPALFRDNSNIFFSQIYPLFGWTLERLVLAQMKSFPLYNNIADEVEMEDRWTMEMRWAMVICVWGPVRYWRLLSPDSARESRTIVIVTHGSLHKKPLA